MKRLAIAVLALNLPFAALAQDVAEEAEHAVGADVFYQSDADGTEVSLAPESGFAAILRGPISATLSGGRPNNLTNLNRLQQVHDRMVDRDHPAVVTAVC